MERQRVKYELYENNKEKEGRDGRQRLRRRKGRTRGGDHPTRSLGGCPGRVGERRRKGRGKGWKEADLAE